MSVASMVFGNKLTVKQEGKVGYLPGQDRFGSIRTRLLTTKYSLAVQTVNT